MASNNNSKIISDAHPHTVKKFELIETYIKSWAQKLMLTDSCSGIVFIDCMCNSGLYRDDDNKIIHGTPIRVAEALLEVARTYTDKQVHLFFNDNNAEKIEELKKHLPDEERNYKVITTIQDGNELLKWIGEQLKESSHMHFFLLYDPYDASIDWDALLPFFRSWGEVLINAFRYFHGYPEEILYDNMKQVVIKRLLKQEDSTLNRQFEDFAGFYGFKPVLCIAQQMQTPQ